MPIEGEQAEEACHTAPLLGNGREAREGSSVFRHKVSWTKDNERKSRLLA